MTDNSSSFSVNTSPEKTATAEVHDTSSLDSFRTHLEKIPEFHYFGKVTAIKGLLVECCGLTACLSIGSRCLIQARDHHTILCEVVGFREHIALLMPFTELEGVGIGCKVQYVPLQAALYPDLSWKGRVLNAMGEPIDGKGPLTKGPLAYAFKRSPPPAHQRQRVGPKLDLGVKALNAFLSCCYGQRMGIFAGSGVGKSMLLSMITRYSSVDIKVIGLIGERGREVQEFLEDYLGEEGLAQAVVIVATSDESALLRRQAAYLTLTLAEFFRDQNQQVLCMIDSVTRFAMAQREIGLSAGEPPTSKGYTPTVFVELPKLLERAGPGIGPSAITGLFSVLVEGDDHNEPIADAVRGILDGHIVMDRAIAERGRYPAINILRSISRMMPGCNSQEENRLVSRAKRLLATYTDMAEMIRLGAYQRGSDPEIDEAIHFNGALEHFLAQGPTEAVTLSQSYRLLAEALEMSEWNKNQSSA